MSRRSVALVELNKSCSWRVDYLMILQASFANTEGRAVGSVRHTKSIAQGGRLWRLAMGQSGKKGTLRQLSRGCCLRSAPSAAISMCRQFHAPTPSSFRTEPTRNGSRTIRRLLFYGEWENRKDSMILALLPRTLHWPYSMIDYDSHAYVQGVRWLLEILYGKDSKNLSHCVIALHSYSGRLSDYPLPFPMYVCYATPQIITQHTPICRNAHDTLLMPHIEAKSARNMMPCLHE